MYCWHPPPSSSPASLRTPADNAQDQMEQDDIGRRRGRYLPGEVVALFLAEYCLTRRCRWRLRSRVQVHAIPQPANQGKDDAREREATKDIITEEDGAHDQYDSVGEAEEYRQGRGRRLPEQGQCQEVVQREGEHRKHQHE